MSEPLTPDPGGGLVRVRIDLGYDGTDFSGWAVQPRLRTVQGVLEDALRVLFGATHRLATTCAGRTDAGVHARGQVVHVDIDEAVWSRHEKWAARRLAGLLPTDVVVHEVRVAPPGFEARFSALSRRYSYTIHDGVRRWDPLLRNQVLRHRAAGGASLDVDAMNEASRPLVGEHDFAAFCRQRAGAGTVRTLLALSWTRGSDGLVRADVHADAFCHSMVRSLVGALLEVGDRRQPSTWPAEVLRARAGTATRAENFRVAPARGLVLEHVTYPDETIHEAAGESAERGELGRRETGGVTGRGVTEGGQTEGETGEVQTGGPESESPHAVQARRARQLRTL